MTAARPPVQPRDDLALIEGYHSPQLDVAVRLNTNESPFAPPPEFVERWLGELRAVPLHRYPDRAARELRDALGKHLGQPAERVFCANGSNEVLQTLLLDLRRRRAARRHVRADVRAALAHRADHRHRGGRRARVRPTSPSTPTPRAR